MEKKKREEKESVNDGSSKSKNEKNHVEKRRGRGIYQQEVADYINNLTFKRRGLSYEDFKKRITDIEKEK